jgi:hypothetical protein
VRAGTQTGADACVLRNAPLNFGETALAGLPCYPLSVIFSVHSCSRIFTVNGKKQRTRKIETNLNGYKHPFSAAEK